MSTCDRFERKGLELLEQGKPLGEHFETCEDCLAARRSYEHLQREIAAAGAELQPSPEWRARVWEKIEANRKGGLSWLPMRPLASVAALVVLVVVSTVWLARSPDEPFLQSEVVGQGAVVRGADANTGDVLQLRANTGGSAYAELRVYFNSLQVTMSCLSESPCRRSGDSIEADLVLESVGSYRAALFLSERPLPAPTGILDQDAGAAIESGGRVELADPVPVR